jgi:hypothetical protein
MRSNALRKAQGGNSSLRAGIAAFVSTILQSYKQQFGGDDTWSG